MQIIIRRLGQTLRIGEDIEITILAIRGDEVRLGVDAPKSVPLKRKEVMNSDQENLNH